MHDLCLSSFMMLSGSLEKGEGSLLMEIWEGAQVLLPPHSLCSCIHTISLNSEGEILQFKNE